jgi:hypothetical protein
VKVLREGVYEYDPVTRALITQSLEVTATVAVRPDYYISSSSSSSSTTMTAGDVYSELKAQIEGSVSSVHSYMTLNSLNFQAVSSPPTVTFTSYTMSIIHSALPTSAPTSMPSCGVGAEGSNVLCTPCNPGYYLSDVGQLKCQECPLDSYSDIFGAENCKQCVSPAAAYQVGSTECNAYYLNYRYSYSPAYSLTHWLTHSLTY